MRRLVIAPTSREDLANATRRRWVGLANLLWAVVWSRLCWRPEKTASNVQDVAARGGKVMMISDREGLKAPRRPSLLRHRGAELRPLRRTDALRVVARDVAASRVHGGRAAGGSWWRRGTRGFTLGNAQRDRPGRRLRRAQMVPMGWHAADAQRLTPPSEFYGLNRSFYLQSLGSNAINAIRRITSSAGGAGGRWKRFGAPVCWAWC
jgi:hypothetical protein